MLILLGVGIGPLIVILVDNVLVSAGFLSMSVLGPTLNLVIYVASGILSGIISIFISKGAASGLYDFIHNLENQLSELPTSVILSGTIGLIAGLVISFLLSALFSTIGVPWISTILSALVYIIMSYLGIKLGIRRKGEFNALTGKKSKEPSTSSLKILDTSVIIDGRIYDLCKTGFIEGTLVIPEFVLSELRHIADSSDSLKRNRGRRGLDILSKIQKELTIGVQISDIDFEDTAEVDVKLIKLAKELSGKVVTNDYNLNKVAAVQDVMVLNINELSNAVKPVSLPGEEMTVVVVKDGKEAGQGVAYLEDGTMIVVEGGRERQNEELTVVVTSVLQTPAGRMIFSKIKGEE